MSGISWETLGVLLAIVALWSGLLLFALKAMFDRHAAFIDARFDRELDRKILELRTALSQEFVKREDWMRFVASIDRKLDRLWTALDDLKECRDGTEG